MIGVFSAYMDNFLVEAIRELVLGTDAAHEGILRYAISVCPASEALLRKDLEERLLVVTESANVLSVALKLPTCPVTYEAFMCPIVAPDGHTYELTTLLKFKPGSDGVLLSPITRQPMSLDSWFTAPINIELQKSLLSHQQFSLQIAQMLKPSENVPFCVW